MVNSLALNILGLLDPWELDEEQLYLDADDSTRLLQNYKSNEHSLVKQKSTQVHSESLLNLHDLEKRIESSQHIIDQLERELALKNHKIRE